MRKTVLCMLLAFGMMGFAQVAAADDFGTALSVVEETVPGGPDQPGGADAGLSGDYTTNNPAAIAAVTGNFRAGGSVVYNWINFKNGPSVNSFSETVAAKLPVGTLQLNYVYGDSGKPDHTLMGVDADISLQSLSVLYGAQVASNILISGDKLYLGISGSPFSRSKLNFSIPGMDILESKSSGYSLGCGMLYNPAKDLYIGSYYDYSASHEKNFDFFTGMTESVKSKVHKLRVGASWRVTSWAMITGDIQYLNIEGAEKLEPFVGVEWGLYKDIVCLTTGYTNHGLNVGLGAYGPNYGMTVAYMHDIVHEIKPYLGTVDIVSAQVYYTWK